MLGHSGVDRMLGPTPSGDGLRSAQEKKTKTIPLYDRKTVGRQLHRDAAGGKETGS